MIGWPTSPGWLYALNQGLHVTVGIIIVPLLLAKLWSVIPRLFAWPPVTGPVNALERIGILLLVGSAIFQFATGIANAQLYYPWHFDFLEAHYYGGLIFIASLVLHVAVKFPAMRRAYATRREVIAPDDDLRAPDPDARDAQPPWAVRARRGRRGDARGDDRGAVDRRAAARGGALRAARRGRVLPDQQDRGRRADHARDGGTRLPAEARRRGRARADARRAGRDAPAHVRPADRLRRGLVDDPALDRRAPARSRRDRRDARRRGDGGRLAAAARRLPPGDDRPRPDRRTPTRSWRCEVNGAPLSLDHGFPARIIVPALPGVHCTKWVKELHFT